MNLSIRELNELIYSLGITAHHGMLVNKELNESLLEKLYGELNSKLTEEDDDANYLTIPSEEDTKESDELKSVLKSILGDANPLVDEIHSHFVSNEEADEDYRSTLIQDEQRYEKSRVNKGVTQSILDYVEFMGEATYTEMQNYYRSKFGSNSFSHILISLIVPYKNRPTRRYLYKTASGSYVVRVAGLHNWVEKDY
jgi:hypothetical protein